MNFCAISVAIHVGTLHTKLRGFNTTLCIKPIADFSALLVTLQNMPLRGVFSPEYFHSAALASVFAGRIEGMMLDLKNAAAISRRIITRRCSLGSG